VLFPVGRSSINPRIVENEEWRWVFITSSLLLVMISMPFVWAYAAAVPNRHFIGVLVNYQDGMTYLAKMMQGYEGNWLLHLTYTPDPHRGVFLYTFYLALGQLARVLHLEPTLVFHVIRLIGGMFMMITLYRLVADWTDSVDQRRITWALMIIGTGFGWLALALGVYSPDLLLLPEGFPLQAIYANAHFPWAIAATAALAHLLFTRALVDPLPWPETTVPTLALITSTILLVSISPFVLIPLGIAYGVLCIWLWIENKTFPREQVTWGGFVIVFALPLALYNAWAISPANPVIHGWMAQNVTPSPPLWHYLIAYGPFLILGAIGLYAYRRNLHAEDGFLLGWVLATYVLLYAPVAMQRRFALGLIIPLSILAGRGLWRVLAAGVRPSLRLLVVLGVFTTFLPTTVLTIIIPLVGTRDPQYSEIFYLTRDETLALEWLRDEVSENAVVLASPQFSLYIPVYGPRVVYGHPFETVNASARQNAVLNYFKGENCEVTLADSVDYLVIGPRERATDGFEETCLPTSDPVYTTPNHLISIYDIHNR
jgi:hypothetical protein